MGSTEKGGGSVEPSEEPYLDDVVLAVHHAFKRLAEDLDVLVKFPGLDFP